MARLKPTVKTRCVANSYASECETIAEFSSSSGGGLISVRHDPAHNRTFVNVYRTDETVTVISPVDQEMLNLCKAFLAGVSGIAGANNREAAFIERIEDMARAIVAKVDGAQ